jgi:hypothetical protein
VSDVALVRSLPGFANGSAKQWNTLHYVAGGSGGPGMLLAGWPETSYSYFPVQKADGKSRG